MSSLLRGTLAENHGRGRHFVSVGPEVRMKHQQSPNSNLQRVIVDQLPTYSYDRFQEYPDYTIHGNYPDARVVDQFHVYRRSGSVASRGQTCPLRRRIAASPATIV
jgi:hypothetical protein